MCGIAGFCNYTSILDKPNLESMTDALTHRGPNDSGYEFIQLKNANLGLGQRRLSILDLTKNGHQPYTFENLVMVYNGEVYNYEEIREELISIGYLFESNSDTEVIIKSFHRWGVKCVDKFIGMFAFTIFDSVVLRLYMFRDRTGVKPFYYYFDNDNLFFASELKSLMTLSDFKKDIDPKSLMLFFQYGYIPGPSSIFKNTNKLKPGHYIEFDIASKKLEERKYWDVLDFYQKPKLNISFTEASKKLEALLVSAFQYRTISDVPLGVFLSGGYDSSAVASIIQANNQSTIKTYTIGFNDEEHNEATFAKEIANFLKTDHHEHYCSEDDALNIIPKLAEIFDEPFGDTSAIPTVLVSQFTGQEVSVALSGDGGDEMFAGYDIYHNGLYSSSKIQRLRFFFPILKRINPKYISLFRKIYNSEGKFYKFLELFKSKDQLDKFNILSKYFYQAELQKLLKTDCSENNVFGFKLNKQDNSKQELLANSYKTYLPDDILVKVDRATMSVGLEGREPLLDHRIIEFVAQLPYDFKYKNGVSKVILKDIVHRYIPKELMDRKKQGFSVPLDKWLKSDLKDVVLETLGRAKNNEKIFNANYIDEIIASFYLRNGNPYKLWLIFVFQLWYEKWMISE